MYPDNLSAKGSVSSSIHNEEADKVYSLLEDDDKNIWSGFVTRNKQNRVLMEAYLVSGREMEKFLTD